MNHEIIIQKATSTDADRLSVLHHGSFGNNGWSAEQICGSLVLPTTQGWVASCSNIPVGFLLCQISTPQSEILTFCVCPSFRRRGIAEQLLKLSVDVARANGCHTMFLEVAADNPAGLALYEKLGFIQTSKRANYYARENNKADALLLTLTIDAV